MRQDFNAIVRDLIAFTWRKLETLTPGFFSDEPTRIPESYGKCLGKPITMGTYVWLRKELKCGGSNPAIKRDD